MRKKTHSHHKRATAVRTKQRYFREKPIYLVLAALAVLVVAGGLYLSDLQKASGVTGQPLQFCSASSCGGCTISQCGTVGCVWDFYQNECTQDTSPPTQTSGVTATAASATAIDLSWSAATDNIKVKGYKIYKVQGSPCGLHSSNEWSNIGGNTTPLGFSDPGLTRKTSYCYKVSAYDPAGNNGANSSIASATTPGTAPTAPQILIGSATETQVSLSWSAPSDNGGDAVQCYKIYRSTSPGGPYSIISSQGGGACNAPSLGNPGDPTATSYTDSAVSTGTAYYYVATAVNANGQSSNSNEAGATPTTTTSSSTTTTAATCDPASNQCSGCSTQQTCSAPCAWSAHTSSCGVSGGTTSSSTTTTAGGTTSSSTTTTTTPPDITPPAKVSGVQATAGNSQVSLSWTANIEQDLSGYYVYQDAVKIGTVPISFKPPSHPTSYAVTGLSNNQQYSFQVSAVDTSLNEGQKSNIIQATPVASGAADTTPPTILSATPENNSVGVSKTSTVVISFSESMKKPETEAAILITPTASFTKSWNGNILTLTPTLDYGTDYLISVGTGSQDLAGNNFTAVYKFTFRTVASPTTTTAPATTTTQATTTTFVAPTITIVSPATTSGGQQEALSAIQEANKTIVENQGKKDVVEALKLYVESVKAYNRQEYVTSKDLALQAKGSVKDLETTTTTLPPAEIPVVWIGAGLVALLVIGGLGYYFYSQKKSASNPKEEASKTEAPESKPETPSK